MTTSLFDKYIFWETNSSQVAGDSEYMSDWNIREMPRLGGAIALNLADLPENKYGIPVGLQLQPQPLEHRQPPQLGGDNEDMAAMHTGEEEIERGDEQIYGPEDDPIDVYDSITEGQEDEEGSEPVAPVVDAMLYDQMLKKVGPRSHHHRQKNTKRNVEKQRNNKTKKGGYAK